MDDPVRLAALCAAHPEGLQEILVRKQDRAFHPDAAIRLLVPLLYDKAVGKRVGHAPVRAAFHQRLVPSLDKAQRAAVAGRLVLGVDTDRIVGEGVLKIAVMGRRAVGDRSQVGQHVDLAIGVVQVQLVVVVVLSPIAPVTEQQVLLFIAAAQHRKAGARVVVIIVQRQLRLLNAVRTVEENRQAVPGNAPIGRVQEARKFLAAVDGIHEFVVVSQLFQHGMVAAVAQARQIITGRQELEGQRIQALVPFGAKQTVGRAPRDLFIVHEGEKRKEVVMERGLKPHAVLQRSVLQLVPKAVGAVDGKVRVIVPARHQADDAQAGVYDHLVVVELGRAVLFEYLRAGKQ